MSAFFDTNILVYAQQVGTKAAIAQGLVDQGGTISAQVLNELANVLHNKLGRSWLEIEALFDDIESVLTPPMPLTSKTSHAALELARDHNFAFYDALIIAAAIEAGCDTLYSEDLQHGRSIDGLKIVNPFLGS